MFRIGEFSLLAKVTVATLRHYEKQNLLIPEKIDEFSGYRYYSAKQLIYLNKIKFYKDMGFGLSDIKLLLTSTDEEKIIFYRKREVEVKNEIEKRKKELFYLSKEIKSNSNKEETMEYKVEIKTMPKMIVASKKGKVKDYDEQSKVWVEMGSYMTKMNSKCPNIPGHCYTVYLDGEYKEEMEIEVREEVTEIKPNGEGVVYKEVEGIEKLASIIHKGPSNTLYKAYETLLGWIEENKYEIVGELYDACYVGPWDEKDDNKWVREIMVPIK